MDIDKRQYLISSIVSSIDEDIAEAIGIVEIHTGNDVEKYTEKRNIIADLVNETSDERANFYVGILETVLKTALPDRHCRITLSKIR